MVPLFLILDDTKSMPRFFFVLHDDSFSERSLVPAAADRSFFGRHFE